MIVGAGPVGLTLGIELARYGVRVRIVDEAPRRTDKSKALAVWSRTLELLERSGCAARLVGAGYPVNAVNLSTHQQRIVRFTLDGLASLTRYPYALMIPQSETERVLEDSLRGLGITVERGVALTGFAQSPDGVAASLRGADGAEETARASWLIGCDGAHSTVRHRLGMEFLGDTSRIHWILADVHLENVARAPEIDIVWHPSGVLAVFPIADDRHRIIADAGEADEASGPAAEPTLADVQAILDERFPGGVRAADPVWLSAFRISERKVADYRAGRVFLAGDAAHVHSPAGGQGMNTGMQDACNLAWKLAMVVRGTASGSLLDSYSAERSPIAEQVLKVTGHMTAVTTLKGGVSQFLRNHAAALLFGLPPVRRLAADTVSEIAVGYPHSPLNGPHSHGEPRAGRRAPIRRDEPPVGAGDSPRFVLFAGAGGMPAGFLERHAELLEPALREPFRPGALCLVRPDGYVALSGKADWRAAGSYLDGIRDWPALS